MKLTIYLLENLQYHQYKLSISCTICTIMYNLVQYTVDCQNIVSPDKNKTPTYSIIVNLTIHQQYHDTCITFNFLMMSLLIELSYYFKIFLLLKITLSLTVSQLQYYIIYNITVYNL